MKLYIFVLLTVFISSCHTNQDTVILKVSPKLQHMNSWCWAASVAMVNEYFTGQATQDCDIANVYFEGNGKNKCCPFNIKCNRGLKPSHLLYLIQTQMKLGYELRTKALSFDEVVEAISNNEIVMVGLSTNGEFQESHIMIINGYTKGGELLHLIDPGTGEFSASYNAFVNTRPYGEWTSTIIVSKGK